MGRIIVLAAALCGADALGVPRALAPRASHARVALHRAGASFSAAPARAAPCLAAAAVAAEIKAAAPASAAVAAAVAADTAAVAPAAAEAPANRLVPLVTFVSLWYAFNAGFNVQNKVILNAFPFPWAVSWAQLASGLLLIGPAWASGVRSPPKVDGALLLKFLPIAALHCGGHGLQVASMGAGSVFFTHVIKATEPVIGMAVLLAFTGKIAPWWVNLCLSPIVGGVAYAAVKPGTAFDLSQLLGFSAVAALASTVAFAIAKLLAKQLMTPAIKKEHNLDAANNYALLTCCSAALLAIPSFLGEGPAAIAAIRAMDNPLGFLGQLLTCGFFYYGYNEMGFRVLDLLSPVSAAVANSLKRVVVLFAAVVFLGESVSRRKIVGSSVAMVGVLLYSLAKSAAAKAKAKPKAVVVVDVEPPGSWQP
ncbi:triose-phosphate transporter family-domain-containing protein [Pelagophyceae sp. CCMP2097]|nr:triose-phosphate transporter family-domain-containing protein [Pelagophyceae sp. CCMP2097]